MNTCKKCALWRRNDQSYEKSFLGKCACLKFIENDQNSVPKDGIHYSDHDGYQAYLNTGEDFGCIHWSERVEPSNPGTEGAFVGLLVSLDLMEKWKINL